ncbi:MAG TPA: hypothetical protein VGB49_01955, partial [Caulobacteraceae bacterium]
MLPEPLEAGQWSFRVDGDGMDVVELEVVRADRTAAFPLLLHVGETRWASLPAGAYQLRLF